MLAKLLRKEKLTSHNTRNETIFDKQRIRNLFEPEVTPSRTQFTNRNTKEKKIARGTVFNLFTHYGIK